MTGCASQLVQPEKLVATHGYVYVSFPKKDGTDKPITLKYLKNGTFYTLSKRNDPEITSYGQWLPDGEYKIAKFGDDDWGDYLSVFIKAGQLTDLGGLLPFKLGNDEFLMLPVRHQDISQAVLYPMKEYQSVFTTKDVINWSPEIPPKPIKNTFKTAGMGIVVDVMLAYERHVNKAPISKTLREVTSIRDFFELAKQTVPPLNQEFASDESLNLYFGADIGQIRVRKVNGEWGAIDTGTLSSVTSIEFVGSVFLAGFDNGVIRKSTDKGLTWKIISTLDKHEAVIDIDKVNGSFYIITKKSIKNDIGIKVSDELKIYNAKNENFNDITLIRSSINEVSPFNIHGEGDNSFYYVNLFPRLERLDTNSLEWKNISPPRKIFGFHKSNSSNIISAYSAVGAFSKLYISANYGDSWKEYDSPPYVIQDVYFKDANNGQSVKWSMSAFSGKLEYWQYIHQTDSWKKINEAPHGCIYALLDSNQDYKFCITRGGNILSYDGSKWGVEFSTE